MTAETTPSDSTRSGPGRRVPATLGELLPGAASLAPDRPAIVDLAKTLTWSEVDGRVGRMAGALRDVGVGRGDRVGVHFRKSADAFCAMHAVVRIGAIAVPLDPTASASYLAHVCRLAGCGVVLTHPPCASSANQLAREIDLRAIVGIEAPTPSSGVAHLGPEAFDELDPVDPVSLSPDDPSYLITTSGSTGTPKSMCHTHASATGHIRSMLAFFDFGPDDRFADIAPNHFDISTPALWITPTVAATNVVVPEPYQMLPASAAELVERERVTVWYSVPYLLTQLHHRGGLDDRDLSSMRYVLFGGEVFPPRVLASLMTVLPGATFSNVYGPAEVNMCTVHHVEAAPAGEESVPIGVPPPETRIRLAAIDPAPGAEGAEVATGEQGEIWVSGETTMRGYWEQPDLTATSMVDDATGRWYRTGDVARRRPDGVLLFEGRLDHQVKVRGHRVELESIEAVFEDLPGVEYAVAAVVRADDGGDGLVAGVKWADEPMPEAELTGLLAGHLPSYAIPRTIVAVHSGPTTGSGKLDRRTLRADIVAQLSRGD